MKVQLKCKSMRTIIFAVCMILTQSINSQSNAGDYYYHHIENTNTVEIAGYNSSVEDIEIPKSVAIEGILYNVVGIYRDAFKNKINLKSVKMYDNIKSIGYNAFQGCENLSSINIPEEITAIKSGTFEGCLNLSSITLPQSVTIIENEAFYGCKALSSINLPNSLIEIGTEAFYDCCSLSSIEIPESVTRIGSRAFWNCKKLPSINIPLGLTKIEMETFAYCSGLTSLYIPDNVTSIGNEAFEFCEGLKYLHTGNGVTGIGWESFSGCNNLTTIILGKSVSFIGDWAFSFSEDLRDMYSYAEEAPRTSSHCFNVNYIRNVTLHVPPTSINKYKRGNDFDIYNYWNDFKDIVAMTDSELSIEQHISETNILSIHNLEGKKLNDLHKGINIIKLSDGTTKKVVKK